MGDQPSVVRLPEQLARELRGLGDEYLEEIVACGLRTMRIDRALKHYADGGVSFGAAAAQAGIGQAELSRHAYARGMEPPFDWEMVAEELG